MMTYRGRIYGGPLNAVLPTIEKYQIGALVSIINQATMIDTPPNLAPHQHLKLAVNDISQPQPGLVLPEEAHVHSLIRFIEKWDQSAPLLIHCWAGISRSTAGVFIALCVLNPSIGEDKIVALLRQASPTANPNIRLVTLADNLLMREGGMVNAIASLGAGDMVVEGKVFSLPALVSS